MTRHMHTADGSEPGPLICETCGQRFGAVEREDADVNGWRPIATAPRDGTPILACFAPGYVNRGLWPCPVVCVFWGTYHPNAKGSEGWRDGSGHKRPILTHWQPIPPPPREETER